MYFEFENLNRSPQRESEAYQGKSPSFSSGMNATRGQTFMLPAKAALGTQWRNPYKISVKTCVGRESMRIAGTQTLVISSGSELMTNNFIYFYLGKVAVLLFKSG